MLTEYRNVRQFEGERFRRWFQDDYFDLIVWFDDDRRTVHGFQVCYDVMNNEHCLSWKKDTGFRHESVDEGESSVKLKMTPINLPNGPFPYKKVLDEFLDRFPKDDRDLLFIVYDKIIEYTNSGGQLV